MNYTTWNLKRDPFQLKNTENPASATSNTGHKTAVHLSMVSLYSVVSSVLIDFLYNHTILLPIFFTEIEKYSKETLFRNDLQMQCSLTLISKPAVRTVLVCFPSYDPPVAVTPQCHFLIFTLLLSSTTLPF